MAASQRVMTCRDRTTPRSLSAIALDGQNLKIGTDQLKRISIAMPSVSTTPRALLSLTSAFSFRNVPGFIRLMHFGSNIAFNASNLESHLVDAMMLSLI